MKRELAVAMKFVVIIAAVAPLVVPALSVAQAGSIVLSHTIATGVGLASAAQYQVLSNAQWADYEKLLTVATLNGVTKMAANNGQPMDSSSYSNIASMVQAQLDTSTPSPAKFQSMDVAARLRYGIDSLTPLAASQQAGALMPKVLFELEKLKFMQLELVVDPSRQTPADLALFAVRSNALQFIADQVQQASDLAQNDPQYAAAVNIVLKNLTAFDTTNSYAQIQSLYGSALPTLPGANSDGSYTLNKQDLINQYQSVVGAVQAMVDADLNAFESSGGAGARKSSVRAKVGTRTRNTGARKNSASASGGTDSCSADACKVAQGAVTGISKLVGFFDPQLGTQISTVGTAGIQAGYAMDQILTQGVSGLAMLNPLGAIVGAGVSIFSSVFGGGGASANAAVLQQIQKLSQQIARLQQDMDAQFAKVDAMLNTIMTTLDQNFALINYQLGTLNGSAVQIKNVLLDVETQLNNMEYYSLAYQQAEEADTLMLSVNGCLNYAATHNGQDIGSTQFDNCQNTFFTWGQTNALDAIWAPLSSDYSDSGIYNFFEDFSNSGVCPGGCPTPFAVTINYLSQFPAQNLGLSPLSTVTLPNPDEWTLGARTYLLMAFEWPQYASGLNTSYLNQLIQIGTSLQQATQNINSTRSPEGQISENQVLFNAFSAKYTSAITNVQNAANADVAAYQNNPANGFTKNGITPSMWAGGANQTTPWRPSIAGVAFCGGGAPSAPGPLLDGSPAVLPSTLPGAPSTLLTLVPDLYAFSQGYLASGQLSMCINQTQWVNVYEDSNYWDGVCENLVLAEWRQYYIPYDEYGVPDCQLGNLMVTLNINFNNVTVLTASVTTPTSDLVSWDSYEGICGGGDDQYYCDPWTFTVDPNAALDIHWNAGPNLQGQLNTSAQTTQIAQPQLLAAIATQIDSVIAGYQQSVYGMIASDFNAAGTGMQAAGEHLSGDKLLLQANANAGLPISLQSSGPLHSLLYGSQAIYDEPGVQSDFSSFSTSVITDTTDNKITDEIAAMNSRLSQLTAAINTALANVQTNQLPESLPQADVTLQDLQAFVNLQNGNALTPCIFQISPGFASVGAAGGSGTVTVQDPYGCSWTASTGAPWLTIGPNSSGSVNGIVSYSVASDTTDCGREGIVIIGDQMFYVIQAGNPGVDCAGTGGGGGGGGGSTPVVSLSQTNIDFGNETVGTSTAPTTVVLSNTGSDVLAVNGISVSGNYSATDTCGSVSVGGSCTISVIFSPTIAGTQTGAVTINDNASDSPQTIALTGVGAANQAPADFTVTASTVMVSQGSTGTLGSSTLTLTPLNSFASVVHLSNCVVPSGFVGGSCSVPSSVSLTGPSPATTTVTISTTATTAGISQYGHGWLLYGSGLMLGSVFILGIPTRKRKWRPVLGAVFCFILGAGLTACGQGGGNGGSTSVAPSTIRAGTYSFGVTATSGSLSHTVTISVDVQ